MGKVKVSLYLIYPHVFKYQFPMGKVKQTFMVFQKKWKYSINSLWER